MSRYGVIAICLAALAVGLVANHFRVNRDMDKVIRLLDSFPTERGTMRIFGYRDNGSNVVLWTSESR